VDEFSLINAISQHYYKQSSLLKGIGDDAAVFRQTVKDIVTSVDTFVEGVHFSKQTMSPFYIGYRSLAANISDVAAMGASPAMYLVSIVIPTTWKENDIRDIFKGMHQLANCYGLDLVGGDTVSGENLVISVTVIGYVPKGKARYRHSAKRGDIVFVTGTLGDSQAGLHLLLTDKHVKDKDFFIKRHQMPQPKIDFAKGIQSLARVTLNDISDGLANEAIEIAEASQVNITLIDQYIPFSDALSQFSSSLRRKWVYYGGEDFELLGTVAPRDWNHVKSIAKKTGTSITQIGYVEKQSTCVGQVFLKTNQQKWRLYKEGYIHLK